MDSLFLRRNDADPFIQGGDADAKALGDILDPDCWIFQKDTYLLFVFRGELFRAAAQPSASPRSLQTGHGSFTDYVPLELGERRKKVEDELAGG